MYVNSAQNNNCLVCPVDFPLALLSWDSYCKSRRQILQFLWPEKGQPGYYYTKITYNSYYKFSSSLLWKSFKAVPELYWYLPPLVTVVVLSGLAFIFITNQAKAKVFSYNLHCFAYKKEKKMLTTFHITWVLSPS